MQPAAASRTILPTLGQHHSSFATHTHVIGNSHATSLPSDLDLPISVALVIFRVLEKVFVTPTPNGRSSIPIKPLEARRIILRNYRLNTTKVVISSEPLINQAPGLLCPDRNRIVEWIMSELYLLVISSINASLPPSRLILAFPFFYIKDYLYLDSTMPAHIPPPPSGRYASYAGRGQSWYCSIVSGIS